MSSEKNANECSACIALLSAMREREKGLKKRIKQERRSYQRLAHKSRSVRLSSPAGPRIGFFTDRLQELQLAIRLVEGGIDQEDFVKYQNGDEIDAVATLCGEVGR